MKRKRAIRKHKGIGDLPTLSSTKATLEHVFKAYEANYQLMRKYAEDSEEEDLERHSWAARREKKLNAIGVEIRKRMGIFQSNPCRTHSGKDCFYCTGWYIKEVIGKRKHSNIYKYKMVNPGEGLECELSKYAKKRYKRQEVRG